MGLGSNPSDPTTENPEAKFNSIRFFWFLLQVDNHHYGNVRNQSFALKNLGAFLKCQFKFPDLDGRIVAIKYLRHAEDGKPLNEELKKYNEDDVRVLPFIISTLKSYKLKPSDVF